MEVESLLDEEEMDNSFTVFEVDAYFYVGVSTDSKVVHDKTDFEKIKTVFLHDRTDMQQLARMVRPKDVELEDLKVYTGHSAPENYVGEKAFQQVAEKVDHGDEVEISGEKFEVAAVKRPHQSTWTYLLYQRREGVIFTGKEDPEKLYKYELMEGSWDDYSLSEAFCQMSVEPVTPVVENPNPGSHEEATGEEKEEGEE